MGWLIFWLFAERLRWRFRTPGGGVVRYTIRGWKFTPAEAWGEHMAVLDMARRNGWEMVSFPEVCRELSGGG
jgi:hypothetical protein